jgi:hypothetical protein
VKAQVVCRVLVAFSLRTLERTGICVRRSCYAQAHGSFQCAVGARFFEVIEELKHAGTASGSATTTTSTTAVVATAIAAAGSSSSTVDSMMEIDTVQADTTSISGDIGNSPGTDNSRQCNGQHMKEGACSTDAAVAAVVGSSAAVLDDDGYAHANSTSMLYTDQQRSSSKHTVATVTVAVAMALLS